MLFGFIDSSTLLLIIHLFGVVLGGGGAFASDLIFMSAVKDKKISSTEMRFLRLGGKMVWLGLAILVISGVFIFFGDTENYLHSSKFLAKMTIVGIIIINGLVFHAYHIPRLHRHINNHFPSSDEFIRNAPLLLGSGAISMVSWISAIILGSLRNIPYSYGVIMAIYSLVLAVALGLSLMLKNKILFKKT